ncbi:PleD family two-component system response regulator [Altericista sp. CCNU0014]|uniref:response regulator n=1 Tax=Altericista sp. CCNU0014 TaxID=3082949 RepID=UPI0038516F4E
MKTVSLPIAATQNRIERSAAEPSLGLEAPIQVLHRIILAQASGKLSVSDPHDPEVLWQVFVGNGQIHFATSLAGQGDRLAYFLKVAGIFLPFDTLKTSDYQFLCSQWRVGRLTLAQLRAVLTLMTQDALIQILKLPQADVRVERQLGLDPLLISVPIVKLLSSELSALRLWQTVLPDILSPLQRPTIDDPKRWNEVLNSPGQTIPRLHLIQPFLGSNFCLYQIAREMGVELIGIVPLLQFLVRLGLIRMQPYRAQPQRVKPTIACIDGSVEVQANVKRTLEPEGYQVISLTEPTHVWSILQQQPPHMLLLDVDGFDGYSFVKALSRSERFKSMPVVALSERQGIVHRLWARRVGVTDCLAKSFDPKVLQDLVQQIVPTVV